MGRFLTFWKELRRDRRGVSIIELALAMPILSVMLLGLVDVASCYSAQMSVQQATARALERVQATGTTTDFAFVRTEAATAAGVPESQVTIDNWLECNNVRKAATVTVCASGETTARYLQVSISSSYTPFFAYSPLGTRQANGTIALSASSALRTS